MHRVDENDLAHAVRLGLDVVAALACPLDEAGRINPQTTRLALADGRWADVVHVKPVYYQHANGTWRPLSEVCAHHGNRRIAIRPDRVSWVHPRFLLWLIKRQRLLGSELVFGGPGYSGVQPRHLEFAATLTAYPDPNPEVTTVDGHVGWTSSLGNWTTAHDAADGDDAQSSTGGTVGVRFGTTNAYRLYRGFFLFNTAALTAAATVTAAVLSLWVSVTNDADNDGDDWLNVVQSSPASNTDLVVADYDQCGAVTNPTEGATRADITGLSTGAYADWTLDATGRSWISQTSVTKLGMREGHDALSHAPDVQFFTSTDFIAADAASGTSQDPRLVITYTPPPAGLLGDPLRAFQHMIVR